MWLVQWRERCQSAQIGEIFSFQSHRRGEGLAAMHNAMPRGCQSVQAMMLIDPSENMADRSLVRHKGSHEPRLPRVNRTF